MAGGAVGPDRAGGGERPPGAAGLIALLAAGAALGGALWALAGAPAVPDGERLLRALRGSELSDPELQAGAAAAAWLLLGYLALSVALRLLALLAARASGGAAWARAGLRLSTLVTIPAVRRVVDSGVGGALLAASWLPLAPGAPQEHFPVYVATPAPAPQAAPAPASEDGAAAVAPEASPALRYTVAPGEDLWSVARRCYGDGTRFVEIFEANSGRLMAGGERLTDPREIRPGWALSLPGPVPGVSAREGALDYRVRAGDHLWGIAERWLGDGFRWVEIWERNRGREMGGGRYFTDPNVLSPGWVLELPPAEPGAAAPPVPDASAGDAVPHGADAPVAALADPGGATPSAAGAETRGGAQGWPAAPHTALLSAAGIAVLGGAALLVLRRRGPGSAVPAWGGDAGRVALAAGALQEAFSEAGFAGAHPLLLREGGRRIEVAVACPPGGADALAALRYDLARRLDCDVDAAVRDPDRVLLTIPRSGRLPGSGTGARAALAVPVGASADDVVYLNVEAAGSVTVTGTPLEHRSLLRSWLRTFSTLRPPDALALRADEGASELLREEAELPHFGGGAGSAPGELADELEEIIASRDGRPGRALVAIFAPGAAEAEAPEAAMREGPRAGVHVIRCLPPGASGEGTRLPGAVVSFAGEGGEDWGDGVAPPGGIALRLDRGPPLYLEPVLVRRDASPRWSESAGLAGAHAPPRRAPEDPADAAVGAGRRKDAAAGAADVPPGRGRGTGAQGTPAGPPAAEPPRTLSGTAPAAPGGRASGAGSDPGPPVAPGFGGDPDPPPPLAGSGERAPTPSETLTRAAPPPEEPATVPAPGGGEVGGGGDPGGLAARSDGPPPPHSPSAAPATSGTTDAPGPGRQGALLSPDDLEAAGGGEGPSGAPPFTIRCLGSFELRLGDAPLTAWPREKSRELLALLATYGGVSVPRETLVEALWPDYPADPGMRHMFGNAVSGLRSVVRQAAADDSLQPVATALQRYQLQTALFRVDLDDFDAALRRAGELSGEAALAEYARAAALYAGDLLEDEFFPWAEHYRRDYRRRLLDGASRAAALAERLGDGERAAWFYGVILAREPTDEAAACGQMRQLAAAGHLQGVRRVYRDLTAALRAELDDPVARPSPATTALLDELTARAGGAPA